MFCHNLNWYIWSCLDTSMSLKFWIFCARRLALHKDVLPPTSFVLLAVKKLLPNVWSSFRFRLNSVSVAYHRFVSYEWRAFHLLIITIYSVMFVICMSLLHLFVLTCFILATGHHGPLLSTVWSELQQTCLLTHSCQLIVRWRTSRSAPPPPQTGTETVVSVFISGAWRL
jgi:hypothetical protein